MKRNRLRRPSRLRTIALTLAALAVFAVLAAVVLALLFRLYQ